MILALRDDGEVRSAVGKHCVHNISTVLNIIRIDRVENQVLALPLSPTLETLVL